jgi:hypothetical protein
MRQRRGRAQTGEGESLGGHTLGERRCCRWPGAGDAQAEAGWILEENIDDRGGEDELELEEAAGPFPHELQHSRCLELTFCFVLWVARVLQISARSGASSVEKKRGGE